MKSEVTTAPDEHSPTTPAAECPFLEQKKQEEANNAVVKDDSSTRCHPWPLVFLHDPMIGLRDSWFVLGGILISWLWSRGQQEEIKRCPWPFIFFHDPLVGLQDYQTWIVFGILYWIISWLRRK